MERRRDNAQSAPVPDDFFRRFFGDRDRPQMPQMPQRPQQGLGSGVIVRADGYILTNHHVVDGADTVTVELVDRRRLTAKVVGTDQPSDLALLKIEADGLQALQLADSDAVEVGDIVLALGNPLGVGQTVTMGIISAKGRATGLGDGSFEDFIQTDAPINTGNSGGALVNTRGELVGINSQILSPSGGNIGIGFAIPASMARNVMDQLLDGGKVRRGQLGVVAQTVDSAMAESLGLKEVRGAIVADVTADSAAARAGLERGDVIVAVDGHAIADSNALRNRIASTAPGAAVSLKIVRAGAERTVSATLGELAGSSRDGDGRSERSGSGAFGLTVEPLTDARSRELGVGTTRGVVITNVAADSAAARAGLRAGDVIEQVDRQPVRSADELRAALASTPDRPALVLVHRGTQTLFVTL
jgi:Do/DeqQ family serine protease